MKVRNVLKSIESRPGKRVSVIFVYDLLTLACVWTLLHLFSSTLRQIMPAVQCSCIFQIARTPPADFI